MRAHRNIWIETSRINILWFFFSVNLMTVRLWWRPTSPPVRLMSSSIGWCLTRTCPLPRRSSAVSCPYRAPTMSSGRSPCTNTGEEVSIHWDFNGSPFRKYALENVFGQKIVENEEEMKELELFYGSQVRKVWTYEVRKFGQVSMSVSQKVKKWMVRSQEYKVKKSGQISMSRVGESGFYGSEVW